MNQPQQSFTGIFTGVLSETVAGASLFVGVENGGGYAHVCYQFWLESE